MGNPITSGEQNHFKKDASMEVILIPVLFVIGTILMTGFIIWLVHLSEKKRRDALQAIATELGLQFSATQNDDLMERMEEFSLFNKGHSRKIHNVMTTEADSLRLTMFDYQYTVGGGQNSQTHRQTVVAFESDALELPAFSLRPEGFFNRIGAALGMQDIDFTEHPEFSQSFVLSGLDEAAVREFFDQKLLDLFAKDKKVCLQSTKGAFVFFHKGRRKPEEIRGCMDQAFTIHTAFIDRLSRNSPG